jgi:hypothetical protein
VPLIPVEAEAGAGAAAGAVVAAGAATGATVVAALAGAFDQTNRPALRVHTKPLSVAFKVLHFAPLFTFVAVFDAALATFDPITLDPIISPVINEATVATVARFFVAGFPAPDTRPVPIPTKRFPILITNSLISKGVAG